jgi:hypothetical protein
MPACGDVVLLGMAWSARKEGEVNETNESTGYEFPIH